MGLRVIWCCANAGPPSSASLALTGFGLLVVRSATFRCPSLLPLTQQPDSQGAWGSAPPCCPARSARAWWGVTCLVHRQPRPSGCCSHRRATPQRGIPILPVTTTPYSPPLRSMKSLAMLLLGTRMTPLPCLVEESDYELTGIIYLHTDKLRGWICWYMFRQYRRSLEQVICLHCIVPVGPSLSVPPEPSAQQLQTCNTFWLHSPRGIVRVGSPCSSCFKILQHLYSQAVKPYRPNQPAAPSTPTTLSHVLTLDCALVRVSHTVPDIGDPPA